MSLTQINFSMHRMRRSAAVRALSREYAVQLDQLIAPIFLEEGLGIRRPIASLPGHDRFSLDLLPQVVEELYTIGIRSVLLFGVPAHKDDTGQYAIDPSGLIAQAIELIKKCTPELLVMSDLCFCSYLTHGHCGILKKTTQEDWTLDLPTTLTQLAKVALVHGQAGVDFVAPSGMMDGAVSVIRSALDAAHLEHVGIVSYAAKFSSSLYGPFREAADGAPRFGNRSTYQQDYANLSQSIRKCTQDLEEGADVLMIKPAQSYLDVVARIHWTFPDVPLAAYQVSGEFAMIKAAAQRGWLDERSAMIESLTAIQRAGARWIVTYFAKEFALQCHKKIVYCA